MKSGPARGIDARAAQHTVLVVLVLAYKAACRDGDASRGDVRALESAVGCGAMSSMNATEPVEAAVVVILERLGEGEPVEKESNRQGTMRIRADTRRAPTRTGRRTLGAPLGLLCIP